MRGSGLVAALGAIPRPLAHTSARMAAVARDELQRVREEGEMIALSFVRDRPRPHGEYSFAVTAANITLLGLSVMTANSEAWIMLCGVGIYVTWR